MAIPQISVATNWQDRIRMRQIVKDHVTELPEPSILSASTRRGFHLRSDKMMWAVFTTSQAWNLPFCAIVTTGFGKTCKPRRGV